MKNRKQEKLLRLARLHYRKKNHTLAYRDGFVTVLPYEELPRVKCLMWDTMAFSQGKRIVWIDWFHPRIEFEKELSKPGADGKAENIRIPFSLTRVRRPGYLHVRLCWAYQHSCQREDAEHIVELVRGVLTGKLRSELVGFDGDYTYADWVKEGGC